LQARSGAAARGRQGARRAGRPLEQAIGRAGAAPGRARGKGVADADRRGLHPAGAEGAARGRLRRLDTRRSDDALALSGRGLDGQPRTEEIVFSESGEELARHPIDTSSNDPKIEDGGPTHLAGSDDLNDALSQSGKIRACIAERLYTHARLRPAVDADHCALSEVEQALRNGASVKEAWIGAVVNEDLFWRKAQESL
jgi:hypothetical protein